MTAPLTQSRFDIHPTSLLTERSDFSRPTLLTEYGSATRCATTTDEPAKRRKRKRSRGELLAGTLIADRYRLEAPLGKGSFGTVYRALDEATQRPVALKVLGRASSRMKRRFRRGAAALKSLDHPLVVGLLDLGCSKGLHYLAMELPERARDLAVEVVTCGPRPWREAVELTRDCLFALKHLHARGWVHRDVKPANLLVDRSGAAPRALLIDFDLAKPYQGASLEDSGVLPLLLSLETPAHGRAGTPFFMSLRRLQGRAALPCDDVYAAALVLYSALTAALPTDLPSPPQTPAELLKARVDNEIPSLSAFGVHAPPRLDELLHQVLSRHDSRGANAAEFADALNDLLAR